MNFEVLENFEWYNEPENVRFEENSMVIYAKSGTDFMQKIHKGIRKDRYSKMNFQYQYLKGETYEAHCDCTDEENSFGLSVWTKENAKEYCKDLVVRVKVNYEDVGRLVHDNGKIRVRKLTVLD